LEGGHPDSDTRRPHSGEWGYSLANVREILIPCLEAAASRSVLEIGAARGRLTRELLVWAAGTGARITAVDPDPHVELLELRDERPELELLVETSHDALRHVPLPDAVIIDGDHNYYTVSEELRLIAGRAPGPDLPLLMFHDVGWPHARRDTYYDPERIPEEHRQPLARDAALAPWDSGIADGGMHFEWAAKSEGGPRNGVLTAVEDFVAESQGLRLAIVAVYFGFGVLWHHQAPWADAVAAVLEPWNRNKLLERLEANRVAHLAARHALASGLEKALDRVAEQAKQLDDQARRLGEQQTLLRAMLGSRAFAVAEQLSRVHQRGQPVFSRDQIRRLLEDNGGA
jgi:SAM-dependent methyltransferase